MRNEIAEWMLSQVAPPEQAATIVGDLLEAQFRPVEFWRGLLRIAISLGIRSPFRLLRKLFGLIFYAGVSVLFVWALMRYCGQSLWSASGAMLFNWLLGFWRPRRKRAAALRKIA